jgi:hypothetical protein
MDCPKCGAAQDDGREECSSCGIVFARWQPRAPRMPTQSTQVELEKPPVRIPVPFIIVAAFFVIVGGLMWAKHQKELRAKADPDAILNEINNKGANLRRQLREEQAAIKRAQSRAAMTAGAINNQLPADLDESKIIDLIQGCNYFSEKVSVAIPKKFQVNTYRFTLNDYPAISMAAVQHFIEFDPPSFNPSDASRYLPNPASPGDTITVKVVSYAYTKVDVSEDPDLYHFGLGRRRVDITRAQATSDSAAGVAFKWNFENNDGADLAPERNDRNGGAELQKTSAGWSVHQLWRNTFNGSTGIVCQ